MAKKVFFIVFLFFLFALTFPLPVRAQASFDYDVGPNVEDYVWPHSQHRWRTIITNGTSVPVSGRLNATYEAAKYSSVDKGGWVNEGGGLRYDYSLGAFSSKTIDWFGTLKGSDSECIRINDAKSDFYHNGSLVKTERGSVLASVYLTLSNQTVDSITVSTYVNGSFNDTRSLSPGGSSQFRITAGGVDGGGSLFSCSRPFSYSFTVTGVAGATYSCSVPSTALTNNCTSEHTATCTKTTGPVPTLPPGVPTPTLPPGVPSPTPTLPPAICPSGTAHNNWCTDPANCISVGGIPVADGGYCANSGDDFCCTVGIPTPPLPSGKIRCEIPASICVEDGANVKVIQHQDIKYAWIDVTINQPGGTILPPNIVVCRAGDFTKLGGDLFCFWDTMRIENASNYSDFNQKLPLKYLTGPYPIPPNGYQVSVYYPGAGKNPPETGYCNTNLIHCNYKTIGGRVTDVTKTTEPKGIAGVRIEVYNSTANSYRYPVTNSSGYWSVNDLVGTGDFYSVRVTGNRVSPQTAPSGYLPPAKTNEAGWNWDYCVNPRPGTTIPSWADTPLGSLSYECQRAGMGIDCAGPGGTSVDKRCSFSYDPSSLLLPCPTSLNATCNANERATFSWTAVTGAVYYTLRANKYPYNDWFGPGDFTANPIGISYTNPLSVGVSWEWSIHPVKAGEDYFPWQPNVCYAKPLYCPVIVVPTPIPTFIPTPTPRPQVSWFQTTGGDIQSQGDITSIIPACAATRTSIYLSKKGEGETPGVVGYFDNLSIGTVGEVSETRWQAKTAYNGGDMKFDYLKKRLKVDTTKVLPPGSDIPTVNGTYYWDSETLNLNGGAIPNGRKIVIFVTGNVTVTGNITVASGGFFALIAKGNITFSGAVRKAQGFFLADGAINILTSGSPDRDFEGQGSFVGWKGITLTRDLGPGNQNCYPAEAFIERPDFFINAPDEFKLTNSYFKEIEP